MKKTRKSEPPVWRELAKRNKFFLGGVAAGVLLGLTSMLIGTQLENRNSFCASCHTEGESTFYQPRWTWQLFTKSRAQPAVLIVIPCRASLGASAG